MDLVGYPLIKGSPGITGSWIPRALILGFWWHLDVGSPLAIWSSSHYQPTVKKATSWRSTRWPSDTRSTFHDRDSSWPLSVCLIPDACWWSREPSYRRSKDYFIISSTDMQTTVLTVMGCPENGCLIMMNAAANRQDAAGHPLLIKVDQRSDASFQFQLFVSFILCVEIVSWIIHSQLVRVSVSMVDDESCTIENFLSLLVLDSLEDWKYSSWPWKSVSWVNSVLRQFLPNGPWTSCRCQRIEITSSLSLSAWLTVFLWCRQLDSG